MMHQHVFSASGLAFQHTFHAAHNVSECNVSLKLSLSSQDGVRCTRTLTLMDMQSFTSAGWLSDRQIPLYYVTCSVPQLPQLSDAVGKHSSEYLEFACLTMSQGPLWLFPVDAMALEECAAHRKGLIGEVEERCVRYPRAVPWHLWSSMRIIV